MLEGLLHLFSPDRSPQEILRDLFDIFIVAFLMYRAMVVLKGTRAMQMGLGFVAFGLLYMLAKYAELATLMSVLSWLATSAILIVVVVFQNDIRRALIRVGSKAWFSRGRDAQLRVIDEIVAASTELARHRMGALICLERDANVLEFVTNDGIDMDSLVTRELLVSLFIPESVNKTHDGAVLVRDLRIARAGVFFPMPETTRVADPSLGSRHRAAIGITEETDAVVIVVSEERGTITLTFPNGMVQNVDGNALRQALLGLFGRSEKKKAKDAAPETRRVPGSTKPSSAKPKGDEKPSATPTLAESHATAKKATSQSGHFKAVRSTSGTTGARSGSTLKSTAGDRAGEQKDVSESGQVKETPALPSVSMPMPAGRAPEPGDDAVTDVKDLDDSVDIDPSNTPAASRVTQPMKKTELPTTSRIPGDSAGDDQ